MHFSIKSTLYIIVLYIKPAQLLLNLQLCTYYTVGRMYKSTNLLTRIDQNTFCLNRKIDNRLQGHGQTSLFSRAEPNSCIRLDK